METTVGNPISFACHEASWKEGEQFVKSHSLVLVLQGDLILDDGHQRHQFTTGSVFFCRKHQLLKFKKQQLSSHEVTTVSLFLEEEFLQDFAREYGYKSTEECAEPAVIPLQDAMLSTFMNSLAAYETLLKAGKHPLLTALKQREALLLLLQVLPSWEHLLFDFALPVKRDLQSFMLTHYHFNVPLKRFAYLTGRSLSSFKRDFKAIFKQAPARWLLQKRLEVAYQLLQEEHKAPIDIFEDLGFQDLSHFSFAFKKQFGIPPSKVQQS